MLHGRDRELAEIDGLLEGARQGRSGALVITGEPGIGKTALLDEAERRAGDLIHLMELDEARDKLIVDYSMGMKKKTALASALIHRPRVLFLDEPFNGIDPISVRAIRNVLRHLTERGTTIFFSSHVMEVVERLCTRVAIINRGRIVGEGTIEELRQGSSGGNADLEQIFLTLVDARNEHEETLSWL